MLVEDTPEELPIGVYRSLGEAAMRQGKRRDCLYSCYAKGLRTKLGPKLYARIVKVEVDDES